MVRQLGQLGHRNANPPAMWCPKDGTTSPVSTSTKLLHSPTLTTSGVLAPSVCDVESALLLVPPSPFVEPPSSGGFPPSLSSITKSMGILPFRQLMYRWQKLSQSSCTWNNWFGWVHFGTTTKWVNDNSKGGRRKNHRMFKSGHCRKTGKTSHCEEEGVGGTNSGRYVEMEKEELKMWSVEEIKNYNKFNFCSLNICFSTR